MKGNESISNTRMCNREREREIRMGRERIVTFCQKRINPSSRRKNFVEPETKEMEM